MKRTLFALLLLAAVLPPSVSHADGPTTIDQFLEPGGRTRVIAHRGFSGTAPENTLAAVRAAIEVGADMVEVDVTMSADGHLVVIHDDTLDRTTDGRGEVAGVRLAEIRQLDAGRWFSPAFAGERLPTRMGVDAIFTDHPDRLLEVVEKGERSLHRSAPAARPPITGDSSGTGTETETGTVAVRFGTLAEAP